MICSLSRGNRFEPIVAAFPKTCLLIKPGLPGLLDELWAIRQPDNYQLHGEEDAFAALVSRKIERGELAVDYLRDVFAYELARRDLAIELEARACGAAVLETIVEFEHEPEALLEPLARHALPPPGLPRGLFRARLRMSEAGSTIDVDPATKRRARARRRPAPPA